LSHSGNTWNLPTINLDFEQRYQAWWPRGDAVPKPSSAVSEPAPGVESSPFATAGQTDLSATFLHYERQKKLAPARALRAPHRVSTMKSVPRPVSLLMS
jgi:hypothetical protein